MGGDNRRIGGGGGRGGCQLVFLGGICCYCGCLRQQDLSIEQHFVR